MAKSFIKFIDGRCVTLDVERGLKIYLVMSGEKPAESPAQKKFVDTVKRVFLPPSKAPASYKRKYAESLAYKQIEHGAPHSGLVGG